MRQQRFSLPVLGVGDGEDAGVVGLVVDGAGGDGFVEVADAALELGL